MSSKGNIDDTKRCGEGWSRERESFRPRGGRMRLHAVCECSVSTLFYRRKKEKQRRS